MCINIVWKEVEPKTLKAKKTEKNNNEGFDKFHMILLIHVYALAQILQVK